MIEIVALNDAPKYWNGPGVPGKREMKIKIQKYHQSCWSTPKLVVIDLLNLAQPYTYFSSLQYLKSSCVIGVRLTSSYYKKVVLSVEMLVPSIYNRRTLLRNFVDRDVMEAVRSGKYLKLP